jgi:hypothetical protein
VDGQGAHEFGAHQQRLHRSDLRFHTATMFTQQAAKPLQGRREFAEI